MEVTPRSEFVDILLCLCATGGLPASAMAEHALLEELGQEK